MTHRRARTTAYLVGVTAEQALAERGSGLVLVSTVRAGLPVGVLMRRWYAFAHWLPVDHYAIGLRPESGVNCVAPRWLEHHYGPARIQFVDAWAESLRERAGVEISGTFLDAVSAEFPTVAPVVAARFEDRRGDTGDVSGR